jgi:CheY-like chemotaxis protein
VATRRSILIADDEFGLADMLREMLGEYDYDVTLAINGRLALDILRERRVDVVITDLMMPVMDGLELATVMRGSSTLRGIPIILMTSLPSEPKAAKLYDAVLRKPFTPELLLSTLNDCFARIPDQPSGEGDNSPETNQAEPS